MGAFKTTPGDAATTLAGLAPLPAIIDALADKAHCRWKNLPSQHGVSMLLAQPRMAFLDTHLIPTNLKLTRHGWLPIAPTPRKTRKDHTAPSPLIRLEANDWKSDFPPDWNSVIPRKYPPNVEVRRSDWSRALEDVGWEIELESERRDVYVVLVAVDQRFHTNPRGHGIVAKLGRDEEASITHFPLPFRLNFESTVHAITNAVTLITSQSHRPATLYSVHHHAFKHALLPADTEYMHDARQNAGALATWPHQLTCARISAKDDWPVLSYLRRLLKSVRADQPIHKTAPYFRALIRRRLDARWEEEFALLNKGNSWLKLNIGKAPPLPGRRRARQFYPYMRTPRKAAQLTYAMTAHAPIGSYQKRFLHRESDECPTCKAPQTRDHVLSACGRYLSISMNILHFQPDSIEILAHFLEEHPSAFSFAHAPYEPP